MALNASRPEWRLRQAGCVRAYMLSKLPDDCPPTFIRLPKAWWPPDFHKLRDPVVRLKVALYGHPRAGDMWHDKLEAILKSHGYETIEGWPSVHVKRQGSDICAILVYVDDLVVLGVISRPDGQGSPGG